MITGPRATFYLQNIPLKGVQHLLNTLPAFTNNCKLFKDRCSRNFLFKVIFMKYNMIEVLSRETKTNKQTLQYHIQIDSRNNNNDGKTAK